MFRDQEEAFKATRESAKRATDAASSAFSLAGKLRPHGLTQWHLPADASISMASILIEAGAAARLARSLTQTRAANMPASRLNELNGTVSALAAGLERFVTTATDVTKDARPLKYNKDGKVLGSITNEQYYDFGEIISDIFHRIEALRNATALIGVVSHDPKAEQRYEESVSEVARKAAGKSEKIEEVLAEARERAKVLTSLVESSEAQSESLSDTWKSAQATFDEMTSGANKAKETVEAIREEISEIKSATDTIKAELDQSLSETSDKIEEIDVFHSKVKEIESELGNLRAAASKGDDLQKQYTARVVELIKEAEEMVSGATTAGLAKAFDEERQRLSDAMVWALFSFLIGIAFLFLTTILLAAYVFEIPIEILGYNVGQSGSTLERGDEITLAGVLSRTVILLAPFWLTLFSSRRYRNLFDLRQQYTHKYSMAFSVDGFKQQAPTYAEQMAAWVFHVVSEPPVTVKSSRSMGDNPLPDINAAIKEQLGRFGVLKGSGPTDESGN